MSILATVGGSTAVALLVQLELFTARWQRDHAAGTPRQPPLPIRPFSSLMRHSLCYAFDPGRVLSLRWQVETACSSRKRAHSLHSLPGVAALVGAGPAHTWRRRPGA